MDHKKSNSNNKKSANRSMKFQIISNLSRNLEKEKFQSIKIIRFKRRYTLMHHKVMDSSR